MTDPKPTYTTKPGDRLIVEPDGTWRVNRNGERVAPDPDRGKLEREAGSRLPDADAACERWESEKDER